MKNRLQYALLFSLLVAPTVQAQTLTMESEPNSRKVEADVVVGMAPGDMIRGMSLGTDSLAGDPSPTTIDTFDITTAAQATPGWYRYTLNITGGNSATIRGLTTTGSLGSGGSPVPGTDSEMQEDTTITGNSLRWYANEAPSRLYVRVQGVFNSPSQYTMTLSVDPVTPIPAPFTAGAGSITIETAGQGHSTNTEIAIADSNRELIPDWVNSSPLTPGSQASLTRSFPAGTYYLLITDWDLKTEFGPANDDAALFGGAMDFSNATLNNNGNAIANLTFTVGDGSANFTVPASKPGIYGIAIYELVVGVSSIQGFCFGDGGATAGCTPCPCGNNAPFGTPSGCLNSSGQGARLVSSGLGQISNDTLHFDVTGGTANTFGLLVSAPNQLPQMGACPPGSGIAPPNFDGLRCVGGGLFRHGSRAMDASGSTTTGWGPPAAPTMGLAAQAGYQAGQTRNFQVFYRENPALSCGSGQNTTNAFSITYF